MPTPPDHPLARATTDADASAASVPTKPTASVAPSGGWTFGSLFMGGFECSMQRTLDGRRLDLIRMTQHGRLAAEDYALCRAVGIRAVREAARWPNLDREGRLDVEEVHRLARLGREAGLVQVWDLFHYGYPDDLDPGSEAFVDRFRAYAVAVARAIREETDGPLYLTPVNEISYYAYSGGDIGYMAPFWHGRGGELKLQLVRASIAATDAVWAEVDPEATIVNVDPLVRQHAPPGRDDLQGAADHFNRHVVTEAFDMLAGRIAPELGGSRRHLGIVGLNYYACNQWTIPTPDKPQRFLERGEPGWIRLRDSLHELSDRYGGPILLAETGDSGRGRAGWLAYLADEVESARGLGADVQGICLYPIVTSPDWEDPTAFFDGGLFDVVPEPDGTLRRTLDPDVSDALQQAQRRLDLGNLPADAPTVETPFPYGGFAEPVPIKPKERAAFRPDNFSYQTLHAGEHLVVELYGFEPGASLPPHRHARTEHVWTVVEGHAHVCVDRSWVELAEGESLVVPAGAYHLLHNRQARRLLVQQVSAEKPWDARFGGPHPAAKSKG